MMTRMKRWYHENSDDVKFFAVSAAVFTAATAITVYAAKAEAEYKKQVSEYIVEQNMQGRTVYQLIDGSFISVDHRPR